MSNRPNQYDLAIIGGGINGCGIARDAAGRGLKVVLIEQGDLAQGTSSASTKLIHGGLRYLEHYEFRLVREALSEREVLLKNAPHIIWPLRFILPHNTELRPQWMIRLGLLMYDHLGGRKLLPATKTIDLTTDITGKPLASGYSKGFEYSDCWVDDARLVVLNALDAQQRGATILTQTQCTHAQRQAEHWDITLSTARQNAPTLIQAKGLVNAAGPWVDQFLHQTALLPTAQHHVRLVRGSHIVVPKVYEHDRAYIFQNGDGRIIFAIPYEQNFTLIGTTDCDHTTGLGHIAITPEEIDYLCKAASEYFKNPITPAQVVWTYAGVRPLYDDGASAAQEATRDYVLAVSDENGKTPLLNVFGGKITTYRRLAEDALHKLQPYYPQQTAPWTYAAPLAGGNFAITALPQLLSRLQQDYTFLTPAWAQSLIRRYGTRAWDMLANAQQLSDMGQYFGATLTEREVYFLCEEEWASSSEAILWRRTKLGLHMTLDERNYFMEWFANL
ncbi:glycerol-3-phosphate dehydrogenase [Thiofilum flexile]|uniref:glycerol-3-phosphate dehydrogenase n=1 Tax=Thiofilum flexile TaxID=125627 RepID=UPI0003741A34|nr:glycerol-3-phosphate dehydrogenase [Thiofilum flexile]